MLRSIICKSPYLLGLSVPIIGGHDNVSKESRTAQSFYNQADDTETGWDRIHMMFSMDEFGTISPELNSVYQAGYLGLLTGAGFGGFVRSRGAYLDFMERNQATTFRTHLEAKKKLQDYVTVNFAKGAFQWGWRLGAFSASYVLVTTGISVYRGKSGIMEYMVAGGLTGAVYKCSLGLRGVAVGGGLGAVLGGLAGSVSLLVLAMSGTSMEEVRYWQYKWKTQGHSQAQNMYKLHESQQEDPLLKHHNAKPEAVDNIKALEIPSTGST